jgi:hypothetical protein
MGAIGGGPTFVGTLVGHGFTSEAVNVVSLTMAAGSILYVVTRLVTVAGHAPTPRPACLRTAPENDRWLPHRRSCHRSWGVAVDLPFHKLVHVRARRSPVVGGS